MLIFALLPVHFRRATLGAAIAACAIALPMAAQATHDDDSASIARRARDVEMRVVQEYGTPAQIAAFGNPHHVPAGVQKPKFPKNPKGPEDMVEWMSYAVYSMEPDQIFTSVYQLAMYERYLKGTLAGPSPEDQNIRRTIGVAAAAANYASQGLAFVPGGAVAQPFVTMAIHKAAEYAMAKEQATEAERQAAAEGLALTSGLDALMAKRLTAEGLEKYRAEDASAKAAQLFQVADAMLEEQGVPPAFVVFLMEQMKGSGGARTSDFRQMATMFDGDERFSAAKWQTLTKEQQWVAMTEALHRVLREGSESMAEPVRAAAFVQRLGLPADQGGSSLVLGTFGPSALPVYRHASAEDKRQIELGARSVHAAAEFVVRLSIGAEETATHAN